MAARFLIWDFDGTLGYRDGLWSDALLEVLSAYFPGRDVDVERLRPYMQRGFPWHEWEEYREPCRNADHWWLQLHTVFEQAFCEACKLEPEHGKFLAGEVRERFLQPERWHLYNDTVPALDSLSAQGWRHILLSNHVPELREILNYLGLRAYFERVYNSAETGVEKPHPAAFLNVLEALPDGAEAVMIGDNPFADMEGAESVGLPGVLVRQQHPSYLWHESLLGLEPALESVCECVR